MHSNFKNKGYFLARYVKLNEFGQNFTILENCWISEAVHGLASCLLYSSLMGCSLTLTRGWTFSGEGLCLLSSIPWVDPGYASHDTKYYLALIGQALTGMAAPFITCLPTKISQHWFGNNFQAWVQKLFSILPPSFHQKRGVMEGGCWCL